MIIRCPRCQNVQQNAPECVECGAYFERIAPRKRSGVLKALVYLLPLFGAIALVESLYFSWELGAPAPPLLLEYSL